MVYNEAGQLKTKYLHSQNDQAFLQKVDYTYNIRGWLTGINDPGLTVENDRFGLKLYYNSTSFGSTAYWNGNISAEKWGDGGYRNQVNTYTYDKVNRITSGKYPTGMSPSYSFLSTYTYDKNGNFDKLTRRGLSGSFIDQITYGYKGGNSNRLDFATDASGDIASVEDYPGTLTGANHFQYDANGNLTRDDYRSLNITYNSFNLPSEFDFGSNKKVNYIYDGSGQKIAKMVSPGSTFPSYTEYMGQFVHEYTAGSTSSLKYIITPEGRLKNKGTNVAPVWEWEYNLTDHLGNVRVVIRPMTNNYAEIMEYTNYFPFGMKMTPGLSQSSTDNKYRYNGKEQQTDFGLNLYDYGARFYDATIVHTLSLDPHAENSYNESPYSFLGNNPINNVDPTGMDWFTNRFSGDQKWYDDNKWRLMYSHNEGGSYSSHAVNVEGISKESRKAAAESYVFEYSLNQQGIETYRTDSRLEAFASMVSLGALPEFKGLGNLFNSKTASVAENLTKTITNPASKRLARVIPANVSGTKLGIGVNDVFVTAADDIAGLSASQIAKRLSIPNSSSGFKVIEFDTPSIGLSSPINRTNPGFVGFGRTAGGAREFTIPNQNIPSGSTIRIVK